MPDQAPETSTTPQTAGREPADLAARANGHGPASEVTDPVDRVLPAIGRTTRFTNPTDFTISLRPGRGADAPDDVRGERRQPMRGFEDTYVDIIDYIVRITHRIWDDQDVGYIYDTYAPGCRMFTDSGME